MKFTICDTLFRSKSPRTFHEMIEIRCYADVLVTLERGVWGVISGSVNFRAYLMAAMGVVWVRFAWGGWFPPRVCEVNQVCDVVGDALSRGKRVVVCCWHGRERSGFFQAVYRMRVQGWTFDAAFREWCCVSRARWPTTLLWRRRLRQCMNGVK